MIALRWSFSLTIDSEWVHWSSIIVNGWIIDAAYLYFQQDECNRVIFEIKIDLGEVIVIEANRWLIGVKTITLIWLIIIFYDVISAFLLSDSIPIGKLLTY